MTDAVAVEAAAEEIDDLDVLLCTPGVNVRKRLLDIIDEEFDRVVDLNMRGTFHLMRAFGRLMGRRGKGSIIVLSSIRVNAIAPGVVDTPLTRPIKADAEWYRAYAEKSALGRWARIEELVGPIFHLASDASSYVTGSCPSTAAGPRWTGTSTPRSEVGSDLKDPERAFIVMF